ncbi:uncharacterized protein SCHCODRAFT_02601136 [Schizophyllum commune H4-8]|uniref:Uncharacterized protein n=1 Tax=Schizophyllum commune (strain H4-8 / FGSC 9210) TaxID=578458 RepID=D8Q8U6_SCHCM|nr:uncharacterized protein SCHCODRAFT_02601136 [Schizophyllum commune H4-8]KAI5890667.1 hypothetical protein SCHCODRAFT_02601136 [Schizophyllum commune H4-8]
MGWRKAHMRSPCAPWYRIPFLEEWASMGGIGRMLERIDLRSLPLEADGACSGGRRWMSLYRSRTVLGLMMKVTDRGDELEKYPVGWSSRNKSQLHAQPRRCYNEWTIDLIDGHCRLHVEFTAFVRPRGLGPAHRVSRSMYARGVGPLESAGQTRFDRYAGALLGWRLLPETVVHALILSCNLTRAAEEASTQPMRCMVLFGSSRGIFTELTAMRRPLGLWAWRRLPNLFFPDHRPQGDHPTTLNVVQDLIFSSPRETMTIATTGITFEDSTCFGAGQSGSCAS